MTYLIRLIIMMSKINMMITEIAVMEHININKYSIWSGMIGPTPTTLFDAMPAISLSSVQVKG